jgi:uncharacterized repeat protein (TIGR03803 family)
MKTTIATLSWFAAFMAGLLLSDPARAQTFTNLHAFLGSDGGSPFAALVVSGNTLYGTTKAGGSGGAGTIFRVNIDGSGFTNLHHFNAATEGALPLSGTPVRGKFPAKNDPTARFLTRLLRVSHQTFLWPINDSKCPLSALIRLAIRVKAQVRTI